MPDREASGRRYPLPAVLAITVAAMLAGRTSLAAIASWGRQLDREALRALGIGRPRSPCHRTYQYVFCELDVDAMEAALAAWVRSAGAAAELGHVALDGTGGAPAGRLLPQPPRGDRRTARPAGRH